MFFSVIFKTNNNDLFHIEVGTWSLRIFLDRALLGCTTLPSTLCGLAFMAASTSSTVAYVTNPKPLDLLVFGSLITTQSVSVPHCSKWLLRLSSVVSKLSPPMKSFRSCSGSLGDSDLDKMAGLWEPSAMLSWQHQIAERDKIMNMPPHFFSQMVMG